MTSSLPSASGPGLTRSHSIASPAAYHGGFSIARNPIVLVYKAECCATSRRCNGFFLTWSQDSSPVSPDGGGGGRHSGSYRYNRDKF